MDFKYISNGFEAKKIPTFLPDFTIEEEFATMSQLVDWGLKQSKIPETWKVSQGEGVRILVIDTGHPVHYDLEENIEIGENFILNEGHEDFNGHQTHCTGIICASNNYSGMVGVAPKATCISAKALDKAGRGSFQGLADALDYAVKTKPDIVSMSLGAPSPSGIIHDKIKELYEMNIPVVCAAGNAGNAGVSWPAAYPETIAVASYNKLGRISYYSSKGEMVDWAAPGEKIYSTFLNGQYATLSGTSMACPFLVGIIALMLAKHRKQEQETNQNDCKTIEQIKEHLLKYTLDRGEIGKDDKWGHGIVDIHSLILDKDIEDDSTSTSAHPDPIYTTTTKQVVTTTTAEKTSTTPVKSTTTIKPKKPNSWIKQNIAWIVCGLVALISLIIGLVAYFSDNSKVPVPNWISQDGEVDWDKKLEEEQRANRGLH